MAKKPSKKTLICRLIRSSFNKAAEGNDVIARKLWAEAITHGYEPDPHTTKGLEIAIAKGIKDTRLS